AEVVSDHHRHRPGGRRLGVEEQGGAARGLASGVVEHRGLEELVAGGAPGRLVAALHLAAARRHRLDEGADPGAAVAGEGAVAVGDDDRLDALGVGGGHLADGGALLARGGVGGAEQLHLAGHVDAVGWDPHRLLGDGALAEVDGGAVPAPAGGGGGGLRGAVAPRLGQLVGVGEGGAEPAADADPRALLGARLDPLDAAVLHGDGGAATLLDEHVGEVTATAQGAVEGGPQDRVVDHVITSGPAERFTGAATYNPAILRAGSRPRAAAMGPSQRAMIPPDD